MGFMLEMIDYQSKETLCIAFYPDQEMIKKVIAEYAKTDPRMLSMTSGNWMAPLTYRVYLKVFYKVRLKG
jgi:hypothetical protein